LIEVGSARRVGGAGTATAAAALMAVAIGGGLLAQGAYYPRAQWYVGLLVCAALLLVVHGHPLSRADVRALPLPVGAAFAAWALIDGALHNAVAGGTRYALLVAGLLAVFLICGRLAGPARESLVAALFVVGTALAGLGWLGVLLHRDAWAWRGEGLWRASSALTYPNATAAVLAVLALLCLALLTGQPRSVPLGLAATGLLAGLGATLSRAGLLGLAVGAGVLAATVGPRALVRAGWPPMLGGLIVLAGLVPSMPASSSPHPVAAVVALLAGLAAGAGLPALRPSRRAAVGLVVVVMLGLSLAGAATVRRGVGAVTDARVTLDSPGRWDALHAAWQVVLRHPLTGDGPGLARLTGTRPEGGVGVFRYAHNEYVQVLAELGVVGLALLLGLLVAFLRVLYRARPGPDAPLTGASRAGAPGTGTSGAGSSGAGAPWAAVAGAGAPSPALWTGAVAGCAALVVHAGLDFVWHLPAIPLLAAALVGLAGPEHPARPSGSVVPQAGGEYQ